MNILLIGNGFDLAHGLPTTYKDFLEFAHQFLYFNHTIINRGESEKNPSSIDEYVESLYLNCTKERVKDEYEMLLKKNVWLHYFQNIKTKGGWIDFEAEISEIIQVLDEVRKEQKKPKYEESGQFFTFNDWHFRRLNPIMSQLFGRNVYELSLSDLKRVKDDLYEHLNKLTRALELYLSDFVNNIELLCAKSEISEIKANRVVSFNYTNTFERLYADGGNTVFDYLHGKADSNSSLEKCNLVLGIDEYLKDDERDKDNEYIRFKKFFQRIYKKTGCEYKKWVQAMNSISSTYGTQGELFIYGHSLDDTDGDVLRDLIQAKNMKTTIFYHSDEAYADQIAKLVKVLGEKELIDRVHGQNPSIMFKKQQE